MLLDQRFGAGTLHVLRAAVREFAAATGMPPGRADDVMMAVHELAANAVRHGAGTGRLRMWPATRTLCCQIEDTGPLEPPDGGAWPLRPGHGLWLTRELADQMSVSSGPGWSRVTAVFALRPR